MLRPRKGNSDVSFNDTLLNFGLRDTQYTIYILIFSRTDSKNSNVLLDLVEFRLVKIYKIVSIFCFKRNIPDFLFFF